MRIQIEDDDTTRFEPSWNVLASILSFFGSLPTDVEDDDGVVSLPRLFDLDQNYPNPFNPVTRITYSISGANERHARTLMVVYNVLGQQVTTLVDRMEGPGRYTVGWDGTDSFGTPQASGIYFYRLMRGDREETRKMILLK